MLVVTTLLFSLGVLPITPVPVDDGVINYATFQSHNQKIVQNDHGIFMAYVRTRNEAYTAQQWRLVRSTDGGQSFETLHEATDATNPAVLETTGDGTLYMARPDFESSNAYLYIFRPETGYKAPAKHTIPSGSAGKFCMLLDEQRERLYYASHNGYLATLGFDGEVLSSVQSHVAGPIAIQQYPHLALDAEGVLHFAWTTNNLDKYHYRDIHYMRSRDGAKTWETFAGNTLELPVVADDAGPADSISLEDELEVHTWLSSMAVAEGKLHFVYLAQFAETPRQHYMRFDVKTGKREIDTAPDFKGDALQVRALDGFFTRPAGKPSPLFYTSAYQGRLVTLRSDDNGTTWQDHAQSEATYNPYAIGGARHVTSDGHILGAFTDQRSEGACAVYLLRIPIAEP